MSSSPTPAFAREISFFVRPHRFRRALGAPPEVLEGGLERLSRALDETGRGREPAPP